MAASSAARAHYEEAGTSLLAMTPSVPRNQPEDENKAWQEVRQQLEQALFGKRTTRLSWWEHWGRLAENTLPRRFHWLITPNTSARGSAINSAIVDPTATQAIRICTAGMKSGLMSDSRPWFKMKTGMKNFEPDREATLWFEEVENRVYAVLSGSNFYDAATQMFEDLVVFGTGPMIIYEDRRDVIRCYNPCAGEYYLGAGSDFRINSFDRVFNLTVSQCVEMFGLENVGTEVQGLWRDKGANLETEVIVAHSIGPNFAINAAGMSPKLGVVPGGFPIREVYWLWGRATQKALSVRGFREQPFIAPRWATTSNDPYGRSPGMDALPDILQLQVMTRRQAEAIEKMVRPPIMADVSMKNQPSSILPGRVTYVPDLAKGGMKPIFVVDPKIAEMSGLVEKIQTRVQRWFFNDLFLMLDQMEGVQPRNEMEIAERRGEKLQQLGPVVEKCINEGARPALTRIISIMGRRQLLPPKPKSLQGIPLEIEFISMLSLAQRAAVTAVMERTVTVAAKMQPLFPDQPPLDKINPDAFMDVYADRSAFPRQVLYSDEQVAQTRQARVQAMKAAQQKEEVTQGVTHMLPAVASSARDVSQAASASSGLDTGGGLNAIQMLLGQGGAAPGATGLPQ